MTGEVRGNCTSRHRPIDTGPASLDMLGVNNAFETDPHDERQLDRATVATLTGLPDGRRSSADTAGIRRRAAVIAGRLGIDRDSVYRALEMP